MSCWYCKCTDVEIIINVLIFSGKPFEGGGVVGLLFFMQQQCNAKMLKYSCSFYATQKDETVFIIKL